MGAQTRMKEAIPARRVFSKVDFLISTPSTEMTVGCPGGLSAYTNPTFIGHSFQAGSCTGGQENKLRALAEIIRWRGKESEWAVAIFRLFQAWWLYSLLKTRS
jgi:hypothetical protein